MAKKAIKKLVRREYTKEDVKELRAHSKAQTPLEEISRVMERTGGSLRQKAIKLGIPLGHRRRKAKSAAAKAPKAGKVAVSAKKAVAAKKPSANTVAAKAPKSKAPAAKSKLAAKSPAAKAPAKSKGAVKAPKVAKAPAKAAKAKVAPKAVAKKTAKKAKK